MTERPIVLPDTFNGEGSWSEWKYHFDNVAQVNGWDDTAKIRWLRVRLVGRAQRAVRRVDEEASFADTIKALDERFEPQSRRACYQAELQARSKKTSEGWAEYADDLRILAERGFPDMVESAREQLALQVYLRQLHHPQVAFGVKQKRPSTLDEAVTSTIELETYLPPKAGATMACCELIEEETTESATIAPVTVPSTSHRDQTILQALEKITQRLEALETARIPAVPLTSDRITCYNCGKRGHIARSCPYRQRKPIQQQQRRVDEPNPVRPTNYNNTTEYDANTTVSSYDDDAVSAICAGGYRVEGEVHGVRVKFLVDSGAAVTLMRNDAWERINKKHPLTLKAYKTSGLVGVEGSSLTIHGCATVNLHLGNRVIETDIVVVSPLITNAILGVDFLRKHRACIDLPSQHLILTDQGTNLPLLLPEQFSPAEATVNVCISERMEIPPASEVEILAQVDEHRELSGTWLLEEATKKCPPAVVARALVRVTDGRVPVRLVNIRSEPVTLYRGQKIATIERVDVDCPNNSSVQTVSNECFAGIQASKGELLSKLSACVDEDLSEDERQKFFNLVCRYADIFAGSTAELGKTSKLKHSIDTGTAPPIRQPVRRIPPQRRSEVQQLIDDMLNKGVIERSTSPWASPIVLVRKKDGTIRFCVDYRKVNEITRKDAYPLPRIDATLDTLSGSQWFSTMDLMSGYWQVEMNETDREKTAFCTTEGLFQFRVMPFGLCNAPATFQRLMDLVLAGLQWSQCLVYIDDVIVLGRTFQEHLDNLQEVFQRLRSAGLRLKPSKCAFFQRSVTYLGHVVSREGISADPGKVRKVASWPVPTSPKEVQRFLGFASYYRRFIKNFAAVAKPLHRLTEKGAPFRWTADCKHAFQELRQRLTSTPVLAHPDFNRPFVLDTDASDTGIGAVLSQVDEGGKERVIAYGSRLLSKPERNYCVTRRELLAVVTFVRQFRPYLMGQRFLLRTDHGSLTWLRNFKDPEGQLARWLEILQQFDFEIVHRRGRKHTNADALSRLPCRQCKRDTHFSTQPAEDQVAVVKLLPSFPDLREQQLNDHIVGPVLRAKENDVKPSDGSLRAMDPHARRLFQLWDQLLIKQGCLYRVYVRSIDGSSLLQFVAPKSIREEVLKDLHEGVMGGHLGEDKTFDRVRERFYWPGYHSDVCNWVRTCGSCAARKTPAPKRRAPLQSVKVGAPLQLVAVDILGPFPTTVSGNRYILTVGDYFTRWMEAYPIPNQEARTVAEKVTNEFFFRFSPPEQLHSDQGRQFESQLVAEICKLLGINKTRTTSYHPQSDGLVERFHRTLLSMLASSGAQQSHEWENYLRPLCMAYNSSINPTTGYSPFFLMFGRQVRMPVDVMYGQPHEGESPPTHAATLRDRLEMAYRCVRKRMGYKLDRQKEFYDRKVHGEPYSEGDLVWLCSPVVNRNVGKKLLLPWTGPYKVLRRISTTTYRIQHTRFPRKRVIVHFDRLKLCPPDVRISNHACPPRSRSPPSPTADEYEVTLVPPSDFSTLRSAEASGTSRSHTTSTSTPSSRYPRRIRRKPDFYSPLQATGRTFSERGVM